MTAFRLAIATATGWESRQVALDVPDEIVTIEGFLRRFGYLPEGNKGKLKAFWEGTMRRLKAEHALGDATVICLPT